MIELTPITDPNQLTLGIESQVLTAVQQVRLEETKQKLIDGELRLRASLTRKRNLLLDNDFVQDKDFVFSMEEVDTPVDINVNHWSEERQIVTVNIKGVKGKCMLLFDRYDKNADLIVKGEAGFDIEGNKVECWGVTGNARKITFRKIKEKLAEKCSGAQWEMTTARSSRSVLTYTVEKYQKLAPNAEVSVTHESKSYGRFRSYYFDAVTVRFKNGNLLVVEPGRKNDEESVYRFIDITTTSKSAEELAQYLGQ
jgi:hypothetical protein